MICKRRSLSILTISPLWAGSLWNICNMHLWICTRYYGLWCRLERFKGLTLLLDRIFIGSPILTLTLQPHVLATVWLQLAQGNCIIIGFSIKGILSTNLRRHYSIFWQIWSILGHKWSISDLCTAIVLQIFLHWHLWSVKPVVQSRSTCLDCEQLNITLVFKKSLRRCSFDNWVMLTADYFSSLYVI